MLRSRPSRGEEYSISHYSSSPFHAASLLADLARWLVRRSSPLSTLAALIFFLGFYSCAFLVGFYESTAPVSIPAAEESSVAVTSDTMSRRLQISSRNNHNQQLFEWEYLDLTKKGACGMRKCFFQTVSKTEGRHDGYLVSKHCAKDEKEDYFARVMLSWDLANRLEKGHKMRHFMLEPPQNVKPPAQNILKKINALANTDGKTGLYYGNGTQTHSMVVQKVKIAPSPAVIPRCYFDKNGRLGNFFFDRNSASKEAFVSAVSDRSAFLSTLLEEMQALLPLLAREARLWKDFQVLIDYKGQIYHIDLDRIAQTGKTIPSTTETHICLRRTIARMLYMFDAHEADLSTKRRA